jgi:hypothetical protein
MSIDDYLKQNIDIDAIQRAAELMHSSHYRDIKKIAETSTRVYAKNVR